MHYLPHDAAHQRLGDFNKSVLEQLQELLPSHEFVIVPRITQLITGIQSVRSYMKNAWFDEKKCAFGIQRLDGYRKRFNKTDNRYMDMPDKSNGCSEAADALRQWAQARDAGLLGDYTRTQYRDSYGDDSGVRQQQQQQSGYNEAPATDWRL